jgi:trk system potassium uptake protein TrkA
MKRFIVVGLGTFGSSVARALFEKGHEVVAIDIDERRVDKVGPDVTRAVVGDARERDTLERMGAADADAAVVSTGDDMSASILAVLGLQDLNVEEIHVKVISEPHTRIMDKLGTTGTVLPERDSARNLATRIARGRDVRKYVHLGEEFSIQEMDVPESWQGQTLRHLDLHRKYKISVIARHETLSDTIASPPDPDTELKRTDTLLIAGRDDNLRRAADVE